MKRLLPTWTLGLLVASLPLAGGCYAESSGSPQDTSAIGNAETRATAISPGPAIDAETDASTITAERFEPAAPTLSVTDKPLPADLKLSANLGEIIKLAQAGVDEGVMLSFVTNSAGTFNLGSEEIIYLNDLGVAGSVITAMIQHDRSVNVVAETPAPVPPEDRPTASAPPLVPPEPGEPAPAYPVDYIAPAQPVGGSYFYTSLAPYGNWVDVAGYGSCWQPNAVVLHPTWRPYCDRGRWIYTDCGWYWLSDYSWGATAFHYGRWFSHARFGWCWTPGTVWAPAWVSWRSSSDYCGWAPLPPRVHVTAGLSLSPEIHTFIPFNRLCDNRPDRHRLSSHQMKKVFNQTTLVNNIAQVNNTVIDRGIAPERVEAATRTRVRQVAVRDAPVAGGRTTRPERLERDGSALVVHRPKLPPTLPTRAATAGELSGDGPRQDTFHSPRAGARTRTTPTKEVTTTPVNGRNPATPRLAEPIQRTPNPQPAEVSPTVSAGAVAERKNKNLPTNRHDAPPPTSTTATIQISPSQSKPAREATPRGSLILIGKRNEGTAANQFSVPPRQSEQPHTPPVQMNVPTTSTESARAERRESRPPRAESNPRREVEIFRQHSVPQAAPPVHQPSAPARVWSPSVASPPERPQPRYTPYAAPQPVRPSPAMPVQPRAQVVEPRPAEVRSAPPAAAPASERPQRSNSQPGNRKSREP